MNNEPTDFSFAFYLRLLKQNKAIVVALFVLTALVAFAGTEVRDRGTNQPVVYKSQMTLLVSPPPRKRGADDEHTELESWFANEELLKQLILSEDVLARTAKKIGDPEGWRSLRSAIEFSELTEGKQLGTAGSFLLNISVTAESAEQAQDLGRVLANEVIAYTQDLAAREKVASRQQLELLAVERKAQVEQAQEDILQWRKANDVWDLGQLTQAQSERIRILEEKKSGIQQELASSNAELKFLGSRQSSGLAPPDSSPEEQSKLDSLTNQKLELEKRLSAESKIYTEQSGRLLELRDQQSHLDDLIQEELSALYAAARARLARKQQGLRAQIAEFEEKIRAEKQDHGLGKAQVELQKLEYELEVGRRNYQTILDKIDQMKVEEQAKRNEANFTLVERPSPGVKHGGITVRAVKKEKVGMILFASGVLSLTLTLLYGLYLNHYSLRKQVEILGLKVLGLLPKVKEANHLTSSREPESTIAGQFRRLIVNVMKDPEVKRILVTSCWPSEGKSFVSSNFAAALTRFQLSVSLVDADLRKPFLTSFFTKQSEMGLRQVISDKYPVEELTQPTEVERLKFLPAGTGEADPAELFHHRPDLSALNASDNDILVIDSAPLSVCNDAFQLSRWVDGVILVVSPQHWTGNAELEYLMDLEEHGAKVLGVVLNSVKESELTYANNYKQTYGKYYGVSK